MNTPPSAGQKWPTTLITPINQKPGEDCGKVVPETGKRQPGRGLAKVARGAFHLFVIAIWVFLFFAWVEIVSRYEAILWEPQNEELHTR